MALRLVVRLLDALGNAQVRATLDALYDTAEARDALNVFAGTARDPTLGHIRRACGRIMRVRALIFGHGSNRECSADKKQW